MARVKNLVKNISASVLIVAFLSVFGYCVSYVAKGGKRLGSFTAPINHFASFPGTVITVLTSPEIKGIPPTYTKKDAAFKEINKLDYDLYGLNSFYNIDNDLWEIRLFNFKNDSILHKWSVTKESFNQGTRQFENSEPRNSIILPDYSLIVGCDETYNLFKLDKDSKVIWHNTSKLFHHSLNTDHNGDIWVCSSALRGIQDYKNETRHYRDDYVTKVSTKTGKILFDKSVSDILIENGYKNFVYGFSNQVGYNSIDFDPLHINDIQPALQDSPYWKKGDIFISIRNKSLVFLYRPETNKVVHLLYGPFLNQHDVDIISDKEISIFNNNIAQIGIDEPEELESELGPAKTTDKTLSSSDIVVYNFEDSTYTTQLKHQFDKERIFTLTQGFHEQLSNGDVYVENQNNGIVYIMNEDQLLLRKVFNTSIDNMVERPHWIRIYEHLNF